MRQINTERGPTNKNPVRGNSRTTHELSDEIKFSENGQVLTKWLAHESGHIPRRQDFSNFDDIYLQSQRCGEVKFLVVLIILIYSINFQNLGYLQHQQRNSYHGPSWSHARDFPLVFG